jgi:hypothetical protein
MATTEYRRIRGDRRRCHRKPENDADDHRVRAYPRALYPVVAAARALCRPIHDPDDRRRHTDAPSPDLESSLHGTARSARGSVVAV